MATRMQQRRGTATQWTTANPILAAGEIGFESDTSKFKIGDGVNHWDDLVYYASAEDLSSLIDGAPDLLNTLNELAAAVGDDPSFFTTVASNLSSHSSDTTSVHGIANTAELATLTNVDDKIITAKSEVEGSANDYTDSAVTTHSTDTTSVHGIADTSLLATISDISSHNSDTTNVHGIADTSALALSEDLTTHETATTSVHGIENTAELATLTDIADAIATAATDMSANAGVGIDWNTVSQAFDIDSTVATKTYADDAVSTHNSDTTNVHGISDTSALATKTYADNAVSTHESDTTSVHGIADTSALATKTYADTKASAAETAAATSAASLYATKVAPTITGNTTVENITITGNLTVQGTTTTVDTANLEVTDSLIYLASEQFDTDVLDIGMFGAYGDANAGHLHTGLFRDATDGKWKLISNAAEPTTGVVDLTSANYDTVKLGGVEFSDGTQSKQGVPSITPIISKTASYTLSALTERDSMVEVSSSSATTITIPTNASVAFPVGSSIDISQISTGQVTIAGAAGVTVNATPGLKLRTQWSTATLFKRGTDSWVVYGDLTA